MRTHIYAHAHAYAYTHAHAYVPINIPVRVHMHVHQHVDLHIRTRTRIQLDIWRRLFCFERVEGRISTAEQNVKKGTLNIRSTNVCSEHFIRPPVDKANGGHNPLGNNHIGDNP